jgi:hypothetical protein
MAFTLLLQNIQGDCEGSLAEYGSSSGVRISDVPM